MEKAGTSQQQRDELCKKMKEFTDAHLHANETSSTRKVIIPGVHITQSEREESEPHIMSFGPYYRDNLRLQIMNYHKCLYVNAILQRNKNVALEDYFTSILTKKDDLKESYGGVFDFRQELLLLTLLDSCFIIEYLLRITQACPQNDELINSNRMRRNIEHDMLLLRNQLPLFVLKLVFDYAMNSADLTQFSRAITAFFNRSSFIQTNHSIYKPLPNERTSFCRPSIPRFWLYEMTNHEPGLHRPPIELTESDLHLLHLYHRFLHSGSMKISGKDESSDKDVWSIPSATVLTSAGIGFKKKEKSALFDVSFQNGTLEIPSFFINGFTELMINNLIAFETFNPKIEPEFTAYVKFLDHIVNISEDVTLLSEKSILDHALGSDKEVASMINSIGGKIFYYQTPCFQCLYKCVDKHYKLSRHKWMATLMHDYFSSPWSFIKLVPPIILLVLAFLPTFFAIFSYFHSPI